MLVVQMRIQAEDVLADGFAVFLEDPTLSAATRNSNKTATTRTTETACPTLTPVRVVHLAAEALVASLVAHHAHNILSVSWGRHLVEDAILANPTIDVIICSAHSWTSFVSA